MKKIAFFAVLMAGIIGWAIRDEAKAPGSSAGTSQPSRTPRDQYAQMVSNNARMRGDLKAKYPEVWNDLAVQTRRDLGTCVVTEVVPGILKADCR